jgi:hypothetical protein
VEDVYVRCRKTYCDVIVPEFPSSVCLLKTTTREERKEKQFRLYSLYRRE